MQYSKLNVAQRTFEIIQKSRSREHGDIINNYYIYKNVCARAREYESRDFHVRGTAYCVTFQESCSRRLVPRPRLLQRRGPEDYNNYSSPLKEAGSGHETTADFVCDNGVVEVSLLHV